MFQSGMFKFVRKNEKKRLKKILDDLKHKKSY